MRTWLPTFAFILWGSAIPAWGDGFVLVSLSSPNAGEVVPTGHAVQWTITATVSTGDNQGLALISVDLEQSPANPRLIDIPPAVRPDALRDFDLPRGLCNPAHDGRASAYGGTPVGLPGRRNLAQIGGAQNTFGAPGTSFGQDVDVDAGIGQGPGGQVIAMGSFPAPASPGVYSFSIGPAAANTLQAVYTAPDFSPVRPAETALGPADFSFTVCRPADVNGDGELSVEGDVPAFVALLLGAAGLGDYASCAADMNDDGTIDGRDIELLVTALTTAKGRALDDPPGIRGGLQKEKGGPNPSAGACPTIPGDGDLDWSVDAGDLNGQEQCLLGPDLDYPATCVTYDFDGDGDVDLHDLASFQTAFSGPEALRIAVNRTDDDGTEVNHAFWLPYGCDFFGHNYVGASRWATYDAGFRFHLPQIRQGETIACARLALPATGFGKVDSAVVLRIVGVNLANPPDFRVLRPSQLPKTAAAVDWVLTSNWPEAARDFNADPLIRYSPDISSIINEIVQRPDWGNGGGTVAAIVIEDQGSTPDDYLVFRDYYPYYDTGTHTLIPVSPRLDLYRTVRSTLVGKELLGAPTDHSVTVTAVGLVPLKVYFEYGTSPGNLDQQSSVIYYAAETPITVLLDNLSPDSHYYYRMRYRRPHERDFAAGPLRGFHTRRNRGRAFTFAVQTDSHLHGTRTDEQCRSLYRTTLNNIAAEAPDFLIDLGDTFNSECYDWRSQWPWLSVTYDDVLDFEEAVQRHLAQRPYLDLVCHSSPFFLALGNHEGEQGWRLDGTPDNVAVWACNARKMIYPLPEPDLFYTGNEEDTPFCGKREDYYAWQWGDALFVVLDPYWYTATKPHSYGGPGDDNAWDWTLGAKQYEWLQTTLARSSAAFKFIFSHQMTGGVNTYGRGGIEAARYAVAQRASYEWGGEDESGQPVFDTMRPGWGSPIHQLMVDHHVTIFFHGHDHGFVRQDLDGVIYQECPQPDDRNYGYGFTGQALYTHGDKIANSGHLRVSVSPALVTVEYIRAYLPGDGPNGEIAYAYTIAAR